MNLGTGEVAIPAPQHEDWTVDLVDTGETAQTGARLSRLKAHLHKETFFLTYGDGVSDVDLSHELEKEIALQLAR